MKPKDCLAAAAFAAVVVGAMASEASEPKYLTRSIYVPVEFTLCEHMETSVLYQDDQPVSKLPVKRIFQFTFYPDLGRLLPEQVQIRVEGTYLETGEPFVARLAVTPAGVHSAHRSNSLPTLETLQKRGHKIDVRLDERKIHLACPLFCRKGETSEPEGQ